jgi:hypothetical protein
MSCLANLHTNQNRVADQELVWQSIVQRGNRIIVIDTFFAIPFSDLFRAKSTSNFFCDRRIYKRRFRECKQLKRVRIHDRIIQILTIVFMSLLSRTRRCEWGKTLANSTCVRSPKKRSPSVWRNCFVCVFDGPTISRSSVALLNFLHRQRNICCWTT